MPIHNMSKLKKQIGIENNPIFQQPNYKAIKKEQSHFMTLKKGYLQCDLMFFSHFAGFKYLLTVVDKSSRNFDCEAIKDKQPSTIVKAFEKILSRPYITEIKSIDYDGGTEFMGEFIDWCDKNDIIRNISRVGRKKQTGFIESYNYIVSQLISIKVEEDKLKHPTKGYNWPQYLPKLREIMNDNLNVKYPGIADTLKFADTKKFHKIGEMVRVIEEEPHDATTGKKLAGRWRTGDQRWSKESHKILNIFIYPNGQQVRYLVEGFPKNTFTYNELRAVE